MAAAVALGHRLWGLAPALWVWYFLASLYQDSQVALVVKNPPANGREAFNPRVGKSPLGRKWQPTPVFLPGESHGQKSLVGRNPQGCKKSDKTEQRTLSLLLQYFLQAEVEKSTDTFYHLGCPSYHSKMPLGCSMWKGRAGSYLGSWTH